MDTLSTTDTGSAPSPLTRNDWGQWGRRTFVFSSDIQLVCDDQGNVTLCNRLGARFWQFGARRKNGGLHLREILDEATVEKILAIQSRPGYMPQPFRGAKVLEEGRPRFEASIELTPLPDRRFHLRVCDVSRRQQMESHANRLVTALDATPTVFLLADEHHHITYVNPAFHTATGYTIEDVLGLDAGFLRAPSERAKMVTAIEHVRRGCDWAGELNNVRRDGSLYTVEATLAPIFDREGQTMGYVSCERDITRRKRLERELQQERNFAFNILQSLDAALYALDREFRLTHFNGGWQKLAPGHGWLTFQEPPHLGEALLERIADPAKRAELGRLFTTVLQTGQPEQLDGADPSGGHYLIRISPQQQQGEVVGLLYQVIDQTNLYRLQTQLFQSQKMELIGKLAAGVAHDFNNLLMAVRGNVSLLKMEENLSAEAQDFLDRIEQASVRASEITKRMLTFSRASEERIEVLDFNSVIQEAGGLIRRSISGKINLLICPAPAPVKVRIDATRASQLLLNLCVNAQDAMPDGGSLTIVNSVVLPSEAQLARVPHRAAQYVRCSVADTGKGIPPEVRARIFEPFFTTKAKGAGTGLGLAIVEKIVNQVQGFIEVDSAPGQGTVFHIHLPAVDEPVTPRSLINDATVRQGSGRILLVEDSDLVRDFTRRFLQRAGYEVVEAINATEAVRCLEAERVDLMLTDYDMPGMNGFELTQQVRNQWPGVKVVLASGYLDLNRRQKLANELGCRILSKPYNLREASSLIAEMMLKKP